MEQPEQPATPISTATPQPNTSPHPPSHSPGARPVEAERKRPTKPDHVPDKFWDPEQGDIRTDVLLKSYGELERRLGDTNATIPSTPDDYEITLPSEQVQPDPEVNARLHAAGFTQEQTQLVYDLALEKLSPLIAEKASDLQRSADLSRLESSFGGAARWREISRQLKTWGQTNLPSSTYDSLSCTVDGVIAMHRMMQSGEPSLMGNQGESPGARDEKDLKRMMKDPRYWRDQDPAYVEQVRKGFQALYPD